MTKYLKESRLLMAALLCFALAHILGLFFPRPYPWIINFFFYAAGFAFLAARLRGNAAKMLCVTLMSVFLSLTMVEFYLSWRIPQAPPGLRYLTSAEIGALKKDPSIEPLRSNYNYHHPFLGIAHMERKARIASIRVNDGEMIFDAVYTIMENGWRITPQNPAAETAVVFFGCSFTFGDGLNDRQTYPYKVAEKLGPRYQVFNFGFHGYGSHQMLAQIQNGYLDEIVKKYKKTLVFYSTIPAHELRCAGLSIWDRSGPCYKLENGRPAYKGSFVAAHGPARRMMFDLFKHCLIYQELCKVFAGNEYMKKLHTAIIAEASAIVAEKYGQSYCAFLWPGAPYKNALEAAGVKTLELGAFAPQMLKNPAQYRLHKYDDHPNEAATELASELLAGYIRENS